MTFSGDPLCDVHVDADGWPAPVPAIVGRDGMHPGHAGAAMKIEDGRWTPVARFHPALSVEAQAAANAQAEAAYVDRCAEFAVLGTVA